jgi:hypothetical protein
MIALLLFLAGFVVVGIAAGFWLTARAPLGFQDDNGFHYAQEEVRPKETLPGKVAQPNMA